MAERRVNVGWAEGLHARPASIFVRAATASGVPVTIAKVRRHARERPRVAAPAMPTLRRAIRLGPRCFPVARVNAM
ncbi:hypothetical protein SNARM312S_06588 [Streptomyces narbonensis]